MTSSATTKFQSALPFALLPISPSLSALHASRAHSLNPQDFDSSLHCSQCGSYLLDSSLELHRPRKRRKTEKKSNTLKRNCHRCGFISYTSIGRREAVTQPMTGHRPPIPHTSSPSNRKPDDDATAPLSRSSPADHSKQQSAPTMHTKKTMLHKMLVHNRQQEVGRMKTQQAISQSGLAAFLSSL